MDKRRVGNLVLKTLSKVTKHEAKVNLYGWPPRCMGIFHQPKRPKLGKP